MTTDNDALRPPPPPLSPPALRAACRNLGAFSEWYAQRVAVEAPGLPQLWPPRPPEALLRCIERGQPLAAIEIEPLIGAALWGGEVGAARARRLWEVSEWQPPIRQQLRWRAALSLSALDPSFPKALIDAMPEESPLSELRRGESARIAQLAYVSERTPAEILHRAGLPTAIPFVWECTRAAVDYFLRRFRERSGRQGGTRPEDRLDWLLRCFGSVPPPQRDPVADLLLQSLTAREAAELPRMQRRIVEHVLPASGEERPLSPDGRKRLEEWAGAVSFDSYHGWAEERLEPLLKGLPLGTLQLKLRRGERCTDSEILAWEVHLQIVFWSNYMTRFRAVRALSEDAVLLDLGRVYVLSRAQGQAVFCISGGLDRAHAFGPEALSEGELCRIAHEKYTLTGEWQVELYTHLLSAWNVPPDDGLKQFVGCAVDSRTGMPVRIVSGVRR